MITRALFCFSILILFFSCQSVEDIEITVIQEKTDLFVTGKLKELPQDDFSDFRIDLLDIDEVYGTAFWHGNVSDGALGSTYLFGNYTSEIITTQPLFGMQFWSETLPSDRPWTSEEFETSTWHKEVF